MSLREQTSFIVTTTIKGESKSQLWHADQPLPIGFPFKYVLEKTEKGFRVRSLSRPTESAYKNATYSIHEGKELDLDPIRLKLKSVETIAPIFEEKEGSLLTLFTCIGQSILTTQTITKASDVRLKTGAIIFQIKPHKSSDEFEIVPKTKNLFINSKSVSDTKSFKLSRKEISNATISYQTVSAGGATSTEHTYSWKFGFLNAVNDSALKSKKREALIETQDFNSFQKSLQGAFGVLAFILALAWFWPQPETPVQEVIPPQFAKIVLQKTTQVKEPSAGEQVQVVAKETPKAVKETKVVKAFQTQALQGAVSQLLKGGMTKLLTSSNLAAGLGQTSKNILEKSSQTLSETAGISGKTDPNAKVGTLGGATAGAVGYGKGEYAKVAGQGGKFVSTDIGSISVEEGLTKDEVGAVIHKHMSEVRYCYEASLLRMPNVEGKLLVGFSIGGNGMVKSTEIKSSTLPDARLDDCIIRRLVTWKFPNPKGGITVAVSYPFIFKSLGK